MVSSQIWIWQKWEVIEVGRQKVDDQGEFFVFSKLWYLQGRGEFRLIEVDDSKVENLEVFKEKCVFGGELEIIVVG